MKRRELSGAALANKPDQQTAIGREGDGLWWCVVVVVGAHQVPDCFPPNRIGFSQGEINVGAAPVPPRPLILCLSRLSKPILHAKHGSDGSAGG